MVSKQSLVLVVVSMAVLSACGPAVVGSGRVTDEARAVGAWRTLQVASGIHVSVERGAPGVTVTTDDNLLPLVETFLDGEVLVVRLAPLSAVDTSHGIRAVVRGERFEGLRASGGATVRGEATAAPAFEVGASGGSVVTIAGIDSTSVRVDASGGSLVTFAGRCSAQSIDASGGARVDAAQLACARATVNGSGAAWLSVNASDAVDGSLSGGSQLYVEGTARAEVTSSGGSQVFSGR